MLFDRAQDIKKRRAITLAEEKVSQVKRLEDGHLYWIKVFEKQQQWTVEMSGLSSQVRDLKHSYVFPKKFEMDQIISESERMYLDLLATQMN